MKIAIIGSTQYISKFESLRNRLKIQGHEVRIPAFDDIKGDEYDICAYNRDVIMWADEVYLIWDGRSIGAIFDIGMCFALQKKLVIEYLEPKAFVNFVKLYAQHSENK